jgi:hypothetical protein
MPTPASSMAAASACSWLRPPIVCEYVCVCVSVCVCACERESV